MEVITELNLIDAQYQEALTKTPELGMKDWVAFFAEEHQKFIEYHKNTEDVYIKVKLIDMCNYLSTTHLRLSYKLAGGFRNIFNGMKLQQELRTLKGIIINGIS